MGWLIHVHSQLCRDRGGNTGVTLAAAQNTNTAMLRIYRDTSEVEQSDHSTIPTRAMRKKLLFIAPNNH